MEKYRPLTGIWRWTGILFASVILVLAVNRTFDFRFFIGYALCDHIYYYLTVSLLLPLAFLHVPSKMRLKESWQTRSFFIDLLLALFAFGIGIYFAWNALTSVIEGWARVAPPQAVIMAVILWMLIVESVRRASGQILGIVVLLASLYPIFAEYMPGILNGIGRPFLLTAQFHILSTGSAMGLLLRIYADIIMGFVIFGTAVISTGGGKFFLDLARAVVGRTRGGTAKVAVFASAIFGSLSGSSIANVITTGSFTIPTMKKSGYPPHYAGAVECCASTAGTFTPPVMGATAFVMASFLAIPYSTVVLVAAIPAFLFYFGLYVQIDGWAAKTQERKVVEIEIPSLLKTLKDGWIYLPAIGVLVYYLFVLRLVGESPYVATALLLVLSQFRTDTRFTWQTFTEFIESSGRSLMELLVVMVGIGMLLGSFSITGLAVTFARELLNLAGGNIAFMLILAFVSSFIMGMGMTIVAVYIFLAIIVAPALIAAGLNELAVHLFVMYCGMLSYITPPVALCAFPAATIAGSSPMLVAVTASRLGVALYLLPFFFVLDPALILQGDIWSTGRALLTAMLSMFLISSALEGYMMGIGRLWPTNAAGSLNFGYLLRIVVVISGVLLGLPWWQTDVLGLALASVLLVPLLIGARRRNKSVSAGSVAIGDTK